MKVGFPEVVVTDIADGMTCVSALPHGKAGMKCVGESSLDQADASLQGGVLSCKQEVHVIGHDDKGVELVTASAAVTLERGDEEVGIRANLKQSAAIEGRGCDEVRGSGLVVDGSRHGWKRTARRLIGM